METFTEETFEFWKARIVGGDEGAEVGVMGGFGQVRIGSVWSG